MSYSANQYNNATPISSAPGFIAESSGVVDKKYFTLHNNKLDGSYFPITGDVGLWGTSISAGTDASVTADDAVTYYRNATIVDDTLTYTGVAFIDDDTLVLSGYALSEPFVVTILDDSPVRSFSMTGSQYSYPVAFSIVFYNGSTVVRTIDEHNNNRVKYEHFFEKVLTVTRYVITIYKISSSGAVARLYNTYNPAIMKRYDELLIYATAASIPTDAQYKFGRDILYIDTKPSVSSIKNNVGGSDTLIITGHDMPTLYNIHSVMKSPSRQVYGKVYITYTDPMLDSDTVAVSDFTAYNSNMAQLLDGQRESVQDLFTLYENNLTGKYVLSDEFTQVGWTSSVLSGTDGVFATPPTLAISFTARPIIGLSVYFDDTHECVPKDFMVTLERSDGTVRAFDIASNTSNSVVITDETIPNVVKIEIIVSTATRAGYPVTILEVPVASTILYRGYQDASDLISIDMLEELTYEDEIEALGGVSANECTIVLDNSSKAFNFNNTNSAAAQQLKRNRKIEPWLGAEILPGVLEWYKLGTYWSYRWNVPVGSLSATVVGFDTIGLLDTTSYIHHHMQVNKSVGYLIEYVLEDAKQELKFLTYKIDPALYSIIIPYAWFDAKSHTAALRKISKCYPMHIYCDRDGCICAAPQKLRLDYYYDTWSDSTNVITKEYSSLYTTLPNIVNVTVANPIIVHDDSLANDDSVFVVNGSVTKQISFTKPYVSGIAVKVDCDSSVQYTYEAYTQGLDITFTGSGTVRSIICSGDVVDISNTSLITRRDDVSVHVNGAVTRDIKSDFIQTSELANEIIERVFSLSEHDKYDAAVEYRGDIALTINDPIRLLDGIAPDNRYNIKRHKLFWNGALSGSADLNT